MVIIRLMGQESYKQGELKKQNKKFGNNVYWSWTRIHFNY